MDKRYQVFISSTFVDLEEERQKVMKAILDEDCFPAGMEMFPASDNQQFEFIKTIIDKSDYYVLIIAGRYGTLADDGIGYTEKEFDYAVKKGIPVLVFVHGNPGEIPSKYMERDPEKVEKLERFIEKACKGRLRGTWTNGNQLQGEVGRSLRKAFKSNPRPGWIRSNENALTLNTKQTYQGEDSFLNKEYVNEGKDYFKLKGIKLSDGYSESAGTNLNSHIDELEEGRVLAFTPVDYDIVDNPLWYYYNVKNKVAYKYLKGEWMKL